MKRKLTHEIVFDEIKRKITEGIWVKGDQISTVNQLAEELGVGISSVREAIRILVNQKILKPEQGRGTFVANTSFEEPADELEFLGATTMLQLSETRLIIEPQLAALAARNATKEEMAQIRKLAQEMEKLVRKNEDYLKVDMEFHYIITKASRNNVLFKMINLISDMLIDSRRNTMKNKAMNRRAATYHILIAEAISSRNAEQARDLMSAHLHDILNELDRMEQAKS